MVYLVDDVFQSTLSVRRATVRQVRFRMPLEISIHALRKESDLDNTARPAGILFQSTLSVRRATAGLAAIEDQLAYFNPRSP